MTQAQASIRGKAFPSLYQWSTGDFASWHNSQVYTFGFEGPSGNRPDRLFFILPASKTDPFRQSITITVAIDSDDRTCAVSALHLLFTLHQRHRCSCSCKPPTHPNPLSIVAQRSMHYADASHQLEFQAATQVTHSVVEPPLQPEQRGWQIMTFSF